MHFTPIVEKLPSVVPFVGPETQERARGRKFRARIGANESVFGPSPRAAAAMQQAATEVWKYCDPENHDLKQALAVLHGVGPQNIVVGEGIDGLFGYTVRLFVEPGVTVATSLGAYPTFNFHVAGYGGRLVTVPYRDDREDPKALIGLAEREAARLIFSAARERIAAIATASGLKPLPSAANFVTIDCRRDGAFARRVLSELIARDVFVRMPGVSPLDRCIRVSAGLPSDLDVFEEALPQAFGAAAM